MAADDADAPLDDADEVGGTAVVEETPVEPSPEEPSATRVELPTLDPSARAGAVQHFGLLLDVGVDVSLVVGSRKLTLEQVLAVDQGTIIDLERAISEPIELRVNGQPYARAEIVNVKGRLGARVVELLH